MLDLSPHINSLLFSHDCVVVAGLGGFVSNPHSAELNKTKLRLTPPYKEIGFNSRLTKNDGLLAKEIEDKLNISYPEANSLIEEFVSNVRKSLVESNQFEFKDVGLLYYDMSRNLRFRQNGTVNFSLNSFGLSSVSAFPIKSKSEPITKQAEGTVTPILAVPETKPEEEREVINIAEAEVREKRSAINWKQISVASACLLILLYAIWIPTHMDSLKDDDFQVSDLNPFKETVCNSYELRLDLPEVISIPKEENILKLPSKDLLDLEYYNVSFFDENDENFDPSKLITIKLRNFPAEAATTRVVGSYTASYPGMKYYIIGGCFSLESNAVHYVQKLRNEGYDAAIVDIYKGLFRVAINAYESKEEALLDLDPIRQKLLEGAWIAKI